jgi:hypothetical protein
MHRPSIGGYSIRVTDVREGRDYQSYEALLFHDLACVAHVKSNGDGGADIVSIEKGFEGKILSDMRQLVSSFEADKHGLHPEALVREFINDPEEAVSGYVKLILDLQDIEKVSKELAKKAPKESYYLVMQIGDGWFHEYTYGEDTDVIGANVAYRTFDKAYEAAKIWELKVEKTLTALAIMQGEFHWELTNDQYVELYRP